MLSYLLTFLTALPLFAALAITPKYWGALDTKHLTGSVLIFYVSWLLILWSIFIQVKQQSTLSKSYINIIKLYCKTVVRYSTLLLIVCLMYGFISLSIHWLLSNFIDSEILDRVSLLIFSLGTVIFLLRLRWIQPIS